MSIQRLRLLVLVALMTIMWTKRDSWAQIQNGTFEAWSGTPLQANSWINTNEASSYLQAASPHAGSYAARVVPTATYGGIRQQNIPVSSNTFYRLSVWLMGGNTGGDDSVRLVVVDNGSGSCSTANTTAQGGLSDLEFRQYYLEFYTASNTSTIEIQFGAQQDPSSNEIHFCIDDVALTAITEACFGNGAYENWVGTPAQARKWVTTNESASYSQSTTAHGGSYAAFVTPNATYAGIRQLSIPVASGQNYSLTAWMKGGNTGGNDAVRMLVVDNGNFYTTDTGAQTGLADSTYKKFTLNFTTTGYSSSIEIQFGAYQDPTSNPISFYIDGVSLDLVSTKNSIVFYNPLNSEDTYNRIGGHGVGSSAQFLADVSGDGLDDAIVWFYSNGGWYVAPSLGQLFNGYSQWCSGLGTSSTDQPVLGDVNGDGRLDACIYTPSSGVWRIALSSASSFNTPTTWSSSSVTGATDVFLADVNNDGYDDAVAFSKSLGRWKVGLSNGSSAFGSFSTWKSSFGNTSSRRFLTDVSGDGRADALYFNAGAWYVALASGSSFGTASLWRSSFGASSTRQLVYDIDRDGKGDAAIYSTGGEWAFCSSTGSAFSTSTYNWLSNHRERHNISSPTNCLIGSMDGAGAWGVAYVGGYWFGLKNNNYASVTLEAAAVNSWEAWGSHYYPADNDAGSLTRYDCLSIPTVDRHIQQMHDANFNVIAFDVTNGTGYTWVNDRVDTVVKRIEYWNNHLIAGQHKMYFYIAVGGMQFSPTNPQIFEDECGFVMNRWVGPYAYEYYNVSDKPLIVNMLMPADRTNWTSWTGTKTNANKFTVGYFSGVLYSTSPANDYGWGVSKAPVGSQVMACNPGWDNHGGSGDAAVARGTDGATFRTQWLDVLTNSPASVQVNSYNDFFEDTGIEPAYDGNGPWTDHYGTRMDQFYLLMAKQYNMLYRFNTLYINSYIQENGSADIYKVTSSGWDYQGTYPAMAPVLLVPAGFRSGFSGNKI